jgi:thioredoxin reductase
MYDVVIVGGGPAGLSAALLLSRSCKRAIVIDADHPRNAAAAEIHGFLTRDGISPNELRTAGRNDLIKYECEVVLDVVERVAVIASSAQIPFPTAFEVTTKHSRCIVGRKLLFCIGMSDELPDLPGVRECYGTSIHHCPYCDGWEHRDQHLLAYATDAKKAAGLSLALRGWSSHVTALSDGDPFDAEHCQNLERNGINYADEKVVQFLHEGKHLQGVELQGRDILWADAMFFNSAQFSKSDLAQSLGVIPDHEFSGTTTRKQQTNIPGVFMAGDADGDVQFAIVAAAEGATAAVAINRELLEEDRVYSIPNQNTNPEGYVRLNVGARTIDCS